MAAIMLQGCGSDVGKSILVAGLCRLFTKRGFVVRPFKPQNMSNNAAVTHDGGEIGRAQALQALACRTSPTVHMNPVLLKPQSDIDAQVVVRGKVTGTQKAWLYQTRKAEMLPVVLESFTHLRTESDLVIVEGAGSPAEINLRAGDIANMGFARAANVPVVLIGDIDRGHVIAALVGAQAVLDANDGATIRGFIINKFRGDPTLFATGRHEIAHRTGWPDLGMVPWLASVGKLPAEDAVTPSKERLDASPHRMKIAVPMLSRMANFDEFDALQAEPQIEFVYVAPGTPLPRDADLIVLPGTNSTRDDLAFFRTQGWDIDLAAHIRCNGAVIGICGGFQMLGQSVSDLNGVEGACGQTPGLGFLNVVTVLTDEKVLKPVSGTLASSGAAFDGYEMHVGRTMGDDLKRPFLFIGDNPDGAISANGRIAGTYVHGVFAKRSARAALLARYGASSAGVDQSFVVEAALDDLAAELEKWLDVEALVRIAGLPSAWKNQP